MAAGDQTSTGEGRQRIVDAARACFAESGLAGATIKAVARRAELTEGAVYYHFDSKQALFEEVIRQPLERLVNDFGSLAERLGVVEFEGAVLEINSKMLATMLHMVPLFGVAIFSDIPMGKQWYTTVQTPLLEAGAGAADRNVPGLRSDLPPELLFRALVGVHMGLAIDGLLSGDGLDVERMSEEVSRLMMLEDPSAVTPSTHRDEDAR